MQSRLQRPVRVLLAQRYLGDEHTESRQSQGYLGYLVAKTTD